MLISFNPSLFLLRGYLVFLYDLSYNPCFWWVLISLCLYIVFLCFSLFSLFSLFLTFFCKVRKQKRGSSLMFIYRFVWVFAIFLTFLTFFAEYLADLRGCHFSFQCWEASGLELEFTTTPQNIFQCWEASGLCFMFLTFLTFWYPYKSIENMRIFDMYFLYRGYVGGLCSNLVFL